MSIFDKMKNIRDKTTTAIKDSTDSIKTAYQEKGTTGLGEILGAKTKSVMDSTNSYINEVSKEVSKVKPSAKQIPKDSFQYQASDVALKSIAVIGKVAGDVKKTVHEKLAQQPTESSDNPEPKTRKPKP